MGKRKNRERRGIIYLISALLNILMQDIKTFYQTFAQREKRRALFGKIWHFIYLMYSRIIKEKVPREAGSLAYVTILGFIPFATFIVMLAPDLPFLNVKDKIANVVMQNFIPGSAEAVLDMISGMIERRMSLNIMVFFILLVSSYLLFNNIRSTFDRILSTHAPQSQDLFAQLIKFFGTLVLGLIILVVLFSSSSLPLISKFLKTPVYTLLSYLLPFVMQFFGLLFLYTIMPSARVKRSSLVRGSFWATVIWVVVKYGFDFYIYNLTSYQAVYGVLAALPIFLFWIYLNWLIILGGIVLVSVIDNKESEEAIQKVPQKVVRISMEMFTDDKLNESLKSYLNKKDIKDLVELLDEDGNNE